MYLPSDRLDRCGGRLGQRKLVATMEAFNDLLKRYYAFKKRHSPYDYREWRTGGEIAKECKSILDKIADYIRAKTAALVDGEFTVEAASGAGYYPKSPWIGIFKNGESAVDGVYPVLGFYNDSEGCFIGCAESFSNPQYAFQNEYCSNNGCSQEEKNLLKKTGLDRDSHLARMPKVFEASSVVCDDCLVEALKSALEIHGQYREKYPRRSGTLEVYRRNNETAHSIWYKEIEVDDIGKWLDLIRTQENATWIFRGHGDATWHLKSYLERCCGSIGDDKAIHTIEKDSMTRFIREAHAFPSCQRINGVNILAMMQHYGSATRLLDFTYSPLIALFFARDQNKVLLSNIGSLLSHYVKNQSGEACSGSNISEEARNEIALAVWAVNLLAILGDRGKVNLNTALAESTKEAHKIVLYGTSGVGAGINVVEPKFGNERLSAQSGLFLMARDLGIGFEENLRASLVTNSHNPTQKDWEREPISRINSWSRIAQEFSVVKFVFPATKVEELDKMLRLLRITYKTIYPDLMGIAKDATANL